jgi:hypothetical protein
VSWRREDQRIKRGTAVYDHRRAAIGYLSGSLRYEVLKRAGFRCELCGISADVRATTEVICERLVYGESLRQICCDETMPSRRTVFQWLEKHPEFAELYTAAREAQIDHLLGENVEIADTDPIVERARLRINERQAWIAKLHPRKYR